jgi:hypothetical protein
MNLGTFPGQVNVQPAVGVEGDFCDANPRAVVDIGPGGFVAGAAGVTVGRFAWADPVNPNLANNYGAGAPTGFVHREQNGLITVFLDGYTMLVPQGLGVTLFKQGGFWVKNNGAAAATIGQKAYADNATGKVSFGAAGTPPAGGTSSASTIAINITTASAQLATNVITAASIAGTTLTVTTIGSGTVLGKGQVLGGGSAGTGYVDPATTIVKQLTGTAGSTGTYEVSVSQTVASTAMTCTGGGMTVGGMTTGTLLVGQTLTGVGVTPGTKISGYGTGAGGAGTYVLDTVPTTEAASTVTGSGGTLTIGGTVTGSYKVGDVIHSANTTAGSTILADASSDSILTGAGGAGTYLVSVSQNVNSEEIDVYAGTETKWYAASAGAVGELVKMSATPNG